MFKGLLWGGFFLLILPNNIIWTSHSKENEEEISPDAPRVDNKRQLKKLDKTKEKIREDLVKKIEDLKKDIDKNKSYLKKTKKVNNKLEKHNKDEEGSFSTELEIGLKKSIKNKKNQLESLEKQLAALDKKAMAYTKNVEISAHINSSKDNKY